MTGQAEIYDDRAFVDCRAGKDFRSISTRSVESKIIGPVVGHDGRNSDEGAIAAHEMRYRWGLARIE